MYVSLSIFEYILIDNYANYEKTKHSKLIWIL